MDTLIKTLYFELSNVFNFKLMGENNVNLSCIKKGILHDCFIIHFYFNY